MKMRLNPARESGKIIKTVIGSLQGLNRIANRMPYETFAFYALNRLTGKHYSAWNFNPYNYYEFGTGTGNSLRMFLQSLKRTCRVKGYEIEKFNVFLFDSFEGLPKQLGETDKNPAWEKGDFSGSEGHIRTVIDSVCGSKPPRIRFIKGYYDESLTENLRRSFVEYPPSLVNIDVDLYSSSRAVLEWIEPILQNGTIIHFDDIYEYLGSPFTGELAAINEFNSKEPDKRLLYPFHSFGVDGVDGKIYTFARRN